MNIKRGFLRLWLVGSITWLLIVGFHGYRIYSPLISQAETAESHAQMARVTASNAVAEARAESDRINPSNLNAPNDKACLPTTQELLVRLDQIQVEEHARAEESAAGTQRLQARQSLVSHLELGLVPPTLILVAGASLGWALAGFRGTRRGNTP